jgi:sugar (pentulose or hexulose) kinase
VATFLGVDIGSTTTKASLVSVDGSGVRELGVARVPTPRDPASLLAAITDVITQISALSPVAAVGVTAMAESGIAWDAAGRPLTGILRWDRAVGRGHLDQVLVRHPELPSRTGIPATTKPALVALAVLRADDPQRFARMTSFTGVADLAVAALTGARVTDHTLAARTMMAGADGLEWDASLLAVERIPIEVLPSIAGPGARAGVVTAEASARFALPVGVPVFVAGHDHAVGAWAAGVRAPGDIADSLGTAEAVVRVTAGADPAAATADGFAVGRTVDGFHRTALGGSPACGAMLAAWDDRHPDASVVDALAVADPRRWDTSVVTVLPYPSGRQCPEPDPGAVVRVLPEGSAATATALLQSIVLQARWMRESLDDLAAEPPSRLVILGSLTDRIPVWAPLIAAGTPLPVTRCTAAEPVASGAALLAGVRAGLADADVVLPTSPVAPIAAPALDDAYRRFVAAARTPATQGAA